MKVIPQEKRDFRSDRFNTVRPWKDYVGPTRSTNAQVVSVVFQEPMHQVLEKIKNEPFFKWPKKIARNPARQNPSLYCQYHQDQGSITEECRNLWDHLEQLIQEGKLKELLHHSNDQTKQTGLDPRRDAHSRPLLGTINVIFAALGMTGSSSSRVMSVARPPAEDSSLGPKRAKIDIQPILGFSDEDKIRTIKPHDDALVVTLRIGGYDVKRVLVNQDNAVEIMYPDLYKGLNLKPKDLTAYDSPLVSFEGKTVIPRGQIRLPIQTDLEIVDVDFIVVDFYSPYIAIVAKPWLHTLGVVSSTLH